jgi:hypothetical protein
MSLELDVILADIITNELQIDPTRVVVNNQDFEAPNDDELYIVVSIAPNIQILSSTNKFDPDTNEEVKCIVTYSNLTVELTSKNRDAVTRKEEVIMALTSFYSVQKQEELKIKIFRAGDILDLSFVEGASALNRYNIPVKISSLTEKRTAIEYFDKFRANEILIEKQ